MRLAWLVAAAAAAATAEENCPCACRRHRALLQALRREAQPCNCGCNAGGLLPAVPPPPPPPAPTFLPPPPPPDNVVPPKIAPIPPPVGIGVKLGQHLIPTIGPFPTGPPPKGVDTD
mmetsp:Transcript_8073/g.19890  ORF Transcript_8073/g.19890 Transcript_8073/m.19890 type:complete len:117 (+) Transcript_8073:118-468(+)